MKNTIITLIAFLLVGFVCFSLLYWLFKWGLSSAIGTAVAGAIGGFYSPQIVKYFRKARYKHWIN